MKPRITRSRVIPVWFVTTDRSVNHFTTWRTALAFAQILALRAELVEIHKRQAATAREAAATYKRLTTLKASSR